MEQKLKWKVIEDATAQITPMTESNQELTNDMQILT